MFFPRCFLHLCLNPHRSHKCYFIPTYLRCTWSNKCWNIFSLFPLCFLWFHIIGNSHVISKPYDAPFELTIFLFAPKLWRAAKFILFPTYGSKQRYSDTYNGDTLHSKCTLSLAFRSLFQSHKPRVRHTLVWSGCATFSLNSTDLTWGSAETLSNSLPPKSPIQLSLKWFFNYKNFAS